MSVLIDDIRAFSAMDLYPKQKQWFETILEVAKNANIFPVSSVFNDREIELIKRVIKPQVKQCYRNAHLLTLMFPDKVQYVEGKVFAIIPIEHAFNKVGDKYVDITFEYALNNDPTQYEYVSIGEYKADLIQSIAEETGVYGEYYRYLYMKKENPRFRGADSGGLTQ